MKRRICTMLLLPLLFAAACERGDDDDLRSAYERMMASTERRAAAEPAPAPVESPAAPALDTAPEVGALPIDTLPQAPAAVEPPPPAAEPPLAPDTDQRAAEGPPATQQRTRAGGSAATLRDVRTAEHDTFDRVVFQFDGAAPGYNVAYIDRPIRECGSGRTIPISGQGWLRVRFEPARAHELVGESARATVGNRNRPVDLGTVQQLVLTCDFEGQVEWVLAVASPNQFRILQLTEPTRLVVDVNH